MKLFYIKTAFLATIVCILSCNQPQEVGTVWSNKKANQWYAQQGWLHGMNFTPSTAINQLEMWQAETFDTLTIDKELGWAQNLGFNASRVFLHDLLWFQDSTGFIKRIDKYLEIADRHRIKTMLVLFDGVWNPNPKLGKQPEPIPFTHNSGWVQSPGKEILKDTLACDKLEPYVKGIMKHFANDKRVIVWDLFNEPDNANKEAYGNIELTDKAGYALALLVKTFKWAREVNPSQPLTSGIWLFDWADTSKLSPIYKCMLANSDVISFHCYDDSATFAKKCSDLKKLNRPILCTEYMARPRGNTFEKILPILKRGNIAGFNWGFVNGKTQTLFPWDSWTRKYTKEPEIWFHDILRNDGSPFSKNEFDLLKSINNN